MSFYFNYFNENNKQIITQMTPDRFDKNKYKRFIIIEDEHPSDSPLFVRLLGYELYSRGKAVRRASQYFILRYVVDGEGSFNGIPLSKGKCYLSVPGQEYSIVSSDEKPLEHFWIEFHGKEAPKYINEVFGSISPIVEDIRFASEAEEFFIDIFRRNRMEFDLSMYMYAVFFQLMSLHRCHSCNEPPRTIPRSLQLYYAAVNYIEVHYNEPITVQSVCGKLHIVPDYLYKIFKQYSGMSSQYYIVNYKINIACELLKESDLPVGSVGERVGYNDRSQFSRTFKQHIGKTPLEYRNSMMSKQS